MKALLLDEIEKMRIADIPIQEPGAEEVLIRVEAAGLCGSDFHIYHGTYPAQYPLVQGHEFSGVIEKTGKDVTEWKVGQRVTADPNIYCGHCYYCLKDQENMCENAQASGVTRNGAFAEYVTVPQTQLYQLPDSISFEEGALIEPLACVLYGVKRLKLPYGSRVIIFGAGPMGLLLLKALATGGASRIAVIDIDKKCLERAANCGATDVFASGQEAKAAFPRGFDAVVDATGNPRVIEEMFLTAGKRAKILQFGCADTNAKITVSPYEFYDNDWEYIGTRTAVYTFGQSIDMIAGGRISVKDVISECVSLETLETYLKNGKPAGTLKIIVHPAGNKKDTIMR
ncbi:MAG: zinc-dependent alcohol dehydrogenase family protein [Eubacteriales bacterium]|nr:zinc-dependent alcohol dehydrogenase family protein [Eubacteriales bacterium]